MHSNKKAFTIFFLVLFLYSLDSNSQGKKDNEPGQISIKIGQSTDNDVSKAQPAKFTATYPRGESKSSFNTQGFIELGWSSPNNKDQKINFSLLIEQHKNTLIEKEQDVFQFGSQFNWKIGYFNGKYDYRPKLTGNVKYSRDKINDTKGLQFLGHFSFYPAKDVIDKWYDIFLQSENPFPSNNRELKVNDGDVFFSDFLQIKSSHSLGLEYLEYKDLPLIHFAYNFEVYPLSGLLYQVFGQYQIIRIDLGLNHWSKLNDESTDLFTGNSLNGAIGLNFFTNKEKSQSIGVGYSYKEGGDPLKGLADQVYNELSITAKISLDGISYKN